MLIEKLTVGPLEENCYLVGAAGTGRCAVVDPGAESGRIIAAIERRGLTPERILLTHGHVDHIAHCAARRGALRHRRLDPPRRSALPRAPTVARARGLAEGSPLSAAFRLARRGRRSGGRRARAARAAHPGTYARRRLPDRRGEPRDSGRRHDLLPRRRAQRSAGGRRRGARPVDSRRSSSCSAATTAFSPDTARRPGSTKSGARIRSSARRWTAPDGEGLMAAAKVPHRSGESPAPPPPAATPSRGAAARPLARRVSPTSAASRRGPSRPIAATSCASASGSTGRRRKDLVTADPAAIAAHLRWLHGQEISPRSVRRAMAAMHGFYRDLVEAGERRDDPVENLAAPRLFRRLPKVLTGGRGRASARRSRPRDPGRRARQGDAGAALRHRPAGFGARRSAPAADRPQGRFPPRLRQGLEGARRAGGGGGGALPRALSHRAAARRWHVDGTTRSSSTCAARR